MNNGDFTPGERSGLKYKKPSVFPTAIMIMSFIGIYSQSWSITALVCAAIDVHLSGKWNKKTKIGTIVSLVTIGIISLITILNIIAYTINPGYISDFFSFLEELGKMSPANGNSGLLF